MPASRVTSKTPWHVVFVLDDSGSMSDQPARDVNGAMTTMIDEMKILSQGQKPYFKISVITFGSTPAMVCEAQSEMQLDMSKIACLSGKSGSTNAAAALNDAYQLFQRYPGTQTDFEPFLFFFSDGAPDNEADALQAGDRIKNMTITAGRPRIVTIGFGSPNDDFMAKLATNAELYKKLGSQKDILSFLPAIGTVTGTVTGGAAGMEQAIIQI